MEAQRAQSRRRDGPGLLESYERSLEQGLQLQGVRVQRQVGLPLVYKGVQCNVGYRLDLLVEIKSVDSLNDVHAAQLLTYLKLSERELRLLINFNVPVLKKGIQRLVNNFEE